MTETRARPWRIAFPLFAVLVMAAAWIGYWYLALEIARREFAGLAGHGVRIACEREQWTGFPFRVTLVCDRPVFRIGAGAVTLAGQGSRLSATALVYRPSHVIAELAGPSTLTQTRAPDPAGRLPDQIVLASDGAPVRAGLQFDFGQVERVSARLTDWSGRLTARVLGRTVEDAAVDARALALHWSRAPGTEGAGDEQRLAIEATGVAIVGTASRALGLDRVTLDRAELAIAATQAAAPDGRVVLTDLKAWQAAGGALRLDRLAIVQGPRQATGAGSFRLDGEGRIDGTLDLTVKDLEAVLDDLIAAGRLTAKQAVLAATALRLLSKGAPAPEPGWSRVPVRLSRGRLYLGPFKAAQLAPLF